MRIWAVDRGRRPIVPAWALALSALVAIGFGLIRGFGLVFGLLALLVVVVAFVIFGSDIAGEPESSAGPRRAQLRIRPGCRRRR